MDTQTGLLTSNVVSTNLPQASVFSSSMIPSAIATSSGSTTLHRFPSNPTSSSRFRSPQLGPIVGGVVAAFALILLFIFLLLKHRASQREIRLRAEIDPTPTPLDVVDTREGLGRHVSVNNDGSTQRLGSEVPRPTVYSSQIIPPANVLKRASGCTNYTVLHSPIHDERIHLASEYTSDANLQPEAGGHFQSNSSHDLITNGAITEEMTHTPSYIPGQSPNETHLQTDFTNISTDSDYAPPAYDSLPTRISA